MNEKIITLSENEIFNLAVICSCIPRMTTLLLNSTITVSSLIDLTKEVTKEENKIRENGGFNENNYPDYECFVFESVINKFGWEVSND